MTVERSFGWWLVYNELVVCAHLNVDGVAVDFATSAAAIAGLHVDVAVDLNLGLDEVAEGDSAVEGVFEWLFRSDLICSKSGLDLFITEAVQPLVKLLRRHGSCI